MRNLEESNYDRRTEQESRFLTTKVPILGSQGVVTGLVGVGVDITERAVSRNKWFRSAICCAR